MGMFRDRESPANVSSANADVSSVSTRQNVTIRNTCAGDLVDTKTKPVSVRLSQRLIDLMQRDRENDERLTMRHIITMALNQYYETKP